MLIGFYLKNIFETGELTMNSVAENFNISAIGMCDSCRAVPKPPLFPA